ncbi:copper/zinc superoxide dismutase [Choanephora cucurbitarum]|nr:copper/zinc superoxide dismutase [Choanephora cucurbitarum]
MLFFKSTITATFAAAFCFLGSSMVSAQPAEAIAYLTGINTIDNSTISGTVRFTQSDDDAPTQIVANITGLSVGKHGIHIHQFGDISQGCATVGPHFNPFNRTHHGPYDKDRHVGDLGNIIAETNGSAYLELSSDLVELSGKYSIIGRAIAVHSGEDDLGLGNSPLSSKNGNAGLRWACGAIAYAFNE